MSNGYLVLPESGSGPGVLVIQEWWGLNDQIRETADRFAAEGFVALAPDMYHGAKADEPDEAGKLLMALNKDSFVPAEAIAALDQALSAVGVQHQFHTYREADHAFMNDRNTHGYDPQATADAWSRILDFFRQHLS